MSPQPSGFAASVPPEGAAAALGRPGGDRGASGEPITILVCALGGEGGGVLAEWLYTLAVRGGHAAQSTSVPGVAQRTGATTYYVEIARAPGAAGPVFSLNPVPGAIDLLVSSELLESVRQVGHGMASAQRTQLLSSSARALTVAEKMQLGDGRADDARLLAVLQRHARALEVLDFAALAREAGTAISAVLFGAIAACGALPFARAAYEDTLRASGKGVEASLRGFALAFDAVTRQRAQRDAAQAQAEQLLAALPAAGPAAPALPPALAQRFPAEAHEFIALGLARVVEYQDAAYGEHYLQRLQRLAQAHPTAAAPDAETLREGARWLALWMAFDDIVRVAQLKLGAARRARLRREVAARDDELVKVYEHFKPGVPEFAALLPGPLAARLTAWDARRTARGAEPFALPLRLGSHTVAGAAALRLMAGLRGWRRRGSRFAAEQALIERWLAAVERGAAADVELGRELARCGRLIKGYGSTNERGKHNLLHIVDHLASPEAVARDARAAAAAVRASREAALADEAGQALDRTLLAHGAPARPPREQTIRFYKRRPDLAAR